VVSKVYFFLGNHAEALNFALGAGKLFDVGLEGQAGNPPSPSEREYVETVIGKLPLTQTLRGRGQRRVHSVFGLS